MADPATPDFSRASPEQLARLDRDVAVADGIKLYQAAGGIGVGAQWAGHAQDLAKRGGLTEQEALNLARYRMWKQGMQVPTGPREAPLTDEQIAARRDAFVNGTPQQRAALMEEDKQAIARSHQGYFDSLIVPKQEGKPPMSIAAPYVGGGPDPVTETTPPQAIARDEEQTS